MNTNIPDFSEAELDVIAAALKERYGKDVEKHLADAEIQIDPDNVELTVLPVVVWQERDASFLLCKIADKRFTGRFFYTPSELYRTEEQEFKEVGVCTRALLMGQADNEAQRAGNLQAP